VAGFSAFRPAKHRKTHEAKGIKGESFVLFGSFSVPGKQGTTPAGHGSFHKGSSNNNRKMIKHGW